MFKIKKNGQVTVELLLVLPVFFLMLFFIMDLGLLAHKVIVVNHAAYELARIGSLLAGPKGGSNSSNSTSVDSKLRELLCQMFKNCGQINLITSIVNDKNPPYDPQVGANHIHEDLLVTIRYPVKLALPGSSYFLADNPKGAHIKWITVKVRMPIEKPLSQSQSGI